MIAPLLPPGEPGPVLLFDGDCNLCDATVRFILAHEADHRLRFAAVQSAPGAALLARLGMPAMPSTFVLIEDGGVWLRAAAAARLAAHLRFPWRLGRLLGRLPRALADPAYDLVARNRYRLFGRRSACRLGITHFESRFL